MDEVGDMRHLVTIQELKETKDEYRALAPTWEPIALVYAKIEELAGREFWRAQQSQSELTHVVTIRYFQGLAAKQHRLAWDGRTLNINSVANPDGKKRFHEVRCIEEFVQAPARGY